MQGSKLTKSRTCELTCNVGLRTDNLQGEFILIKSEHCMFAEIKGGQPGVLLGKESSDAYLSTNSCGSCRYRSYSTEFTGPRRPRPVHERAADRSRHRLDTDCLDLAERESDHRKRRCPVQRHPVRQRLDRSFPDKYLHIRYPRYHEREPTRARRELGGAGIREPAVRDHRVE